MKDSRIGSLRAIVTVAVLVTVFAVAAGCRCSASEPATPVPVPSVSPTTSATPTALPTATPVFPSPEPYAPTPTLTPADTEPIAATPTTPAATPIPGGPVAPVATAVATAVVAPSPAPTAAPSLKPVETPTSGPAAPTASAVDRRRVAEKYAVIVHTDNRDDLGWFLGELGTEWYLANDYRLDNIPPGHRKLMFVGRLPVPGDIPIREAAAHQPGAAWMILNEPNRQGGYTPRDWVEELHDAYAAIRATDPTAKILSPSILNWEFTCTQCRGYQKGVDWLAEFRTAWLERYGTEPPVDAWAINVYPLDWLQMPMVDLDLVTSQIEGIRSYLDSIPELAGTPIWITEIGLHWGWDNIDWFAAPCLRPAGEYQTEKVTAFLRDLFDWLDLNGDRLGVEKVFLYISYRNITTCNADYYAGITLFDDPYPGASLTPAGEVFVERTAGHPR